MREPIDLGPSQRKELLSLIARYLPNVEVWAFGSRVKWTARSNSDLDLVAFAKSEDEERISRLKEALEESSLPFRVDLLVWDNIPDGFKKNIRERYVVLVEAVELGRGRVMNFDAAKCVAPKNELIPLSDIANVIGGYAFKGSDFGKCGMPVVKIANIEPPRVNIQSCERIPEEKLSGLDRFRLAKGDVLMAMTGATVGKVGRIRDHQAAYLNQRVAKISSKIAPEYDDFIFALLSQKGFEEKILSNSSGSAQANVSADGIGRVLIPALEPCNKLKIGKFVAAIDDKIDLNRHINQTLEAIAQALFKSWFVDFDPVKAKIAATRQGRDPLRAAMSAISGKPETELDAMPPEQYDSLAATAALFPDEMEESELGEIPKGWMVNQISRFGNVVCGKTPSKENPKYFGIGIPFIKIPDMHNSVYVINPSEQLTALGAASQSKKTIPAGSICVSCIATVGKVVIAHEPSQTNQQINAIIPNLAEYTVYLYFQMKEKEKEFHDLASGGSATLNMNTSTFSKMNVLMPNLEILAKFSAFVAPLFSEILSRQKESAFLSETRDILLPKLLSGEFPATEGPLHVCSR